MNNPETYDAVVVGGGKGGKTLAMYLARQNYKVALIERDPMMIGGGCINVACIPTKTFISAHRASGKDHRPNGWSSESHNRKIDSTDPWMHHPGCRGG